MAITVKLGADPVPGFGIACTGVQLVVHEAQAARHTLPLLAAERGLPLPLGKKRISGTRSTVLLLPWQGNSATELACRSCP